MRCCRPTIFVFFSIFSIAASAFLRSGNASAACPSLPDVSTRIGRAQLDYYDPNYSNLVGKRDYLWSNSDRTSKPHALAGAYAGMYILLDRWEINGHKDPSRNLTWFQHFHPTWIVYRGDQQTPAWEWGVDFVPLDIANPAVQSFIENNEIAPFLNQPYTVSFRRQCHTNKCLEAGRDSLGRVQFRDMHKQWRSVDTKVYERSYRSPIRR